MPSSLLPSFLSPAAPPSLEGGDPPPPPPPSVGGAAGAATDDDARFSFFFMTFFFVRISLSRASSSSSVATLLFFWGLGWSSSPRPVPAGAVGANPFFLLVEIGPDLPPPPPPLDGVAVAGSVEVLPFFDFMILFFGVSMKS